MKKIISLLLSVVMSITVLCATPIISQAAVMASSFTQRTSIPNSSDSWITKYNTSNNCTRYAYGRISEILNTDATGILGTRPGADSFPSILSNAGYSYGYTPRKGAVMCTSGHVAIVESVDENSGTLIVSEGHSYTDMTYNSGIKQILVDGQSVMGYSTITSSSQKGTWFDLREIRYTGVSAKYYYLVPNDAVSPAITNFKITSVTNNGFKVSCTAIDNYGVRDVKFIIERNYNGNIERFEEQAVKNGDTYSCNFTKATVSTDYYVYALATDVYNNQTVTETITQHVNCVKKCETPTISYKNVSGGKTVSISSKTSNSTIYYKTSKDGKYKKYTKALKLTSTKTIYAYAKKSGYKNSSVSSKKITVTKAAAPKITSKNYIGGKKITLSSTTKNAVIYYKTSKVGKYKKYSQPFKITSKKTIYAYSKKSGYVNSSTSKKTYTVSKTPKVTGVKASTVSSSSIKVSWKRVNGASGYYLYRSASKSGTYKKVATVTKGSTLSKTDTGLSSNKTYYYKVRAYTNGKITGNASSYVSAKTKKASKFDSQKAQYNMQNYTDYNYSKNKFVYARNGNIYISSSINKTAKKITTYNGYYGNCINLAVTDKYVFYIDTDNNYIKRCNLDGTNKINFVGFPDDTSYYMYSCSFIIDGNKIIYTITEKEKEYYTITESKTYMVDLNGDTTIKVDDNIDGHIYTYKSKAYFIKNESLYCYDISKNIKTKLLSNLKNRHILGMEGSTLYIDYEPGFYKCGVEKVNVSSPKESVWIMGFTHDEPIQDLIVSSGKIYLTTGTGAGNAFAAVRNSNLNYDSYRKKYDTAGDSLGFYKTGIFIDSYKYDNTNGQYKFNGYKKLVEIS